MNSWNRRLFGLLMRAYPRDHRERYQNSVAEHFEAQAAGASVAYEVADNLKASIGMRFENLWRDLVFAVRMNAKAPLFTAVILGTIALAIASNAIAFALLNAVLLKPLPYANPSQLGFVWQRSAAANGMQRFASIGDRQADALLRASKTLAGYTYGVSQDSVSSSGGAALKREQVKTNYFSVLGVHPLLGRFLTHGSPQRQVVISSQVWRSRYGGANVIGKTMKLGTQQYTIVGVAPDGMIDPSFGALNFSDVWTKIPRIPAGEDTQFPVFPIVRLRDGVTWQAAQADLTRLQRELKGSAGPDLHTTYFVGPLSNSVFGDARSFLWLVFAGVTGVLLIACANVANLLLARASVRESEFSIRSAIGASARRIASQVFTETFLLAAAGAAVGVAVAWMVLPLARAVVPGQPQRAQTATIDIPVLLYVLALLGAVTLLTGVVPAYRRSQRARRDVATRLRPVLVVAEIAVAFALTAAFGVMLHSFVSMTSVPIGFDPSGVYVAGISPNHDELFLMRPGGSKVMVERAQAVQSRVRAIPGVKGVTAATAVPFDNAFMMSFELPSGWNGQRGGPPLVVNATQIGKSYFRLLHIPIVQGSRFTASDFEANAQNVIINQTFAREYFPHGEAIGKHIRGGADWRVIGVVADTRSSFKSAPEPLLYLPYNGGFGPFYSMVIKTSAPVPTLAQDVTNALKSAYPDSAVSVASLSDLIAKDSSGMRTSLQLLGALAAVALLLGLFGIYSVVAYSTERRFHEIGIRMAVGARPWNIISLIVGNALVQAAIGVVAGLGIYALITQLLATQLYKTSPLDPGALAAVTILLILCCASASLIPAFRAALMRPYQTLRYE